MGREEKNYNRPWLSKREDLRCRESAFKTPRSSKLIAAAVPEAHPRALLANTQLTFESFVSDIARNPDLDEVQGNPDEIPSDLIVECDDDVDATTSSPEGDEDIHFPYYALTTDLVNEYMAFLNECSSTLSFEGLPEYIRIRIAQHDCWYRGIVDNLFAEAAKLPETSFAHGKNPGHITKDFWMWLSTNSTQKESILQILLHPEVRSYATRATLGQLDWNRLGSQLQSQSLETPAPNVAASYFLRGHRRGDSINLRADMGYVGIGAAIFSQNSRHQAGARRRLESHLDTTNALKAGLKSGMSRTLDARPEIIFAQKRLAHPDIERVSYVLLSLYPFLGFHPAQLTQYQMLCRLGEVIDIVFMGALDHFSHMHGADLGRRLRPETMPTPQMEGLNRALPTSQSPRPLTWSCGIRNIVEEATESFLEVFLSIFKHHQDEVYGRRGMNYSYVVMKLAENGWTRTEREVQLLHLKLSKIPEFGLELFRGTQLRRSWLRVYNLKAFLQQKHLAKPPVNPWDPYWHIPELEAGLFAFPQLWEFLSSKSYPNLKEWSPEAAMRFGAKHLPKALGKNIWEHIGREPPATLRVFTPRLSPYIAKRKNEVVMFFAWRHPLRGSGDPRSQSSFYDEVSRQSSAQLLADGIPVALSPVRGPLDVYLVWKHTLRTLPQADFKTLSKWKYEPGRNAHILAPEEYEEVLRTHILTQSLGHYEVPGSETETHDECEKALYIWPEDSTRHSKFTLPGQARTPLTNAESSQNTSEAKKGDLRAVTSRDKITGLVQHRVTTFRIFCSVLTTAWTENCKHPHEFFGITEGNFWEQAYFLLYSELEWGIDNNKQFRERYSWILDFIRYGNLPQEAGCVRDALRQVLLQQNEILSGLHPYDCNVYRAFTKLFKPDLCPRWVRGFLERGGMLRRLPTILREQYGISVTKEKILNNYGVLIADLWEESNTGLVVYFMTNRNSSSTEHTEDHQHPQQALEASRNITRSMSFDSEIYSKMIHSAVKRIAIRSYESENAMTWAWLHCQEPPLIQQANRTLFEELCAADPEFRKRTSLTRLLLRKYLQIHDYVERRDFQWHGRILPSSVIASGAPLWRANGLSSVRTFETWSWRPGEIHELQRRQADGETSVRIYFDPEGISFKVKAGPGIGDLENAYHIPRAQLSAGGGELFDYELGIQQRLSRNETTRIQSIVTQSSSTSIKRPLPSESSASLTTKRTKTTGTGNLDQDDRSNGQLPAATTNHGFPNEKPEESHPLVTSASTRYTTEESEWILDKILFIEHGTIDMAKLTVDFGKRFPDRPQRDKPSLTNFLWQRLDLTLQKLTALRTSSWQSKVSIWIGRAAKESQDLAILTQMFNQEFRATFTEDDLEDGYPKIKRYLQSRFLNEKNICRTDHAIEEEEINAGSLGASRGPVSPKEDQPLQTSKHNDIKLATGDDTEGASEIDVDEEVSEASGSMQVDSTVFQEKWIFNLDQNNWLRKRRESLSNNPELFDKGQRLKPREWDKIAADFNEQFDAHLTKYRVRKQWKRLKTRPNARKVRTHGVLSTKWTSKQVDWLKKQIDFDGRRDWDRITQKYNAKFPPGRSKLSMVSKGRDLRPLLKDYKPRTRTAWTPEQKDWLRKYAQVDGRRAWKKIASRFNAKFGTDRKVSSLCSYLNTILMIREKQPSSTLRGQDGDEDEGGDRGDGESEDE